MVYAFYQGLRALLPFIKRLVFKEMSSVMLKYLVRH